MTLATIRTEETIKASPLVKTGRALYNSNVLSVAAPGGGFCLVADPTGEQYGVDVLAGAVWAACECHTYDVVGECVHIGAVQEHFESLNADVEEINR